MQMQKKMGHSSRRRSRSATRPQLKQDSPSFSRHRRPVIRNPAGPGPSAMISFFPSPLPYFFKKIAENPLKTKDFFRPVTKLNYLW
jgi:hypothetical protein